MAGCNRDLVKVRDHVSHRIQSSDCRLLVRIDLKTANITVARSKLLPEFRAYVAAQNGIDHVKYLGSSVVHHCNDVITPTLKGHYMRLGEADASLRQLAKALFATLDPVQGQERDVTGICPHEKRLAAGVFNAAEHSYTQIRRLEPIAYRAISDAPVIDCFLQARDRNSAVHQPGCKYRPLRHYRGLRACCGETGSGFLQRFDPIVNNRDAIDLGLLLECLQQC